MSGEATLTVPGRRHRGRITTLDWLRGIMLVSSITVNSLLIAPAWVRHAAWEGVHPEDLVFPVFVTLSGCGLAFALNRRTDWLRFFRRVVVLAAAGLAYNWIITGTDSWAELRFSGVLQLYAAVVLLTVLGHQITRSWRGWAGWTGFYAIAHSVLLLAWGRTCGDGVVTPECNPSGPVDTAVFGVAHSYAGGAQGYDPEGLISIFGAMVSVSAGATIGHLVLSIRNRPGQVPLRRYVGPLVLLGVALLAFGWFISTLAGVFPGADLPTMKKLWTAPFALPIAGGVALSMAAGLAITTHLRDRPIGSVAILYWLEALGRNSLLVYFGSHILTALLRRLPGGPGEGILYDAIDVLGGGWPGQMAVTATLLVFWIGLALLLNHRKIYVRA